MLLINDCVAKIRISEHFTKKRLGKFALFALQPTGEGRGGRADDEFVEIGLGVAAKVDGKVAVSSGEGGHGCPSIPLAAGEVVAEFHPLADGRIDVDVRERGTRKLTVESPLVGDHPDSTLRGALSAVVMPP